MPIKYNNLKDESLIFLFRLHDHEAEKELLERYTLKNKSLISDLLNQYCKSGISFEELQLVAMNTLYTAIRVYDMEKDSFAKFYYFLARRDLVDYIYQNSYTGKSRGFAGISMDQVIVNSDAETGVMSDVIGSKDSKLESNILLKEFEQVIEESIELSQVEKDIIIGYLNGVDSQKAIEKFNHSKSSYYRIIKKGKELLAKKYASKD